jgi:hypothetical protein
MNRGLNMRLVMVPICVLLSMYSINAFSDTSSGVDWKIIKADYANYIKKPSKQNAEILLAVLPREYISFNNIDDNENQALGYLSAWKSLKKIQDEIVMGDIYAMRIAFRLRAVADGAFAEDLDIAIGQGIKNHSDTFLHELQSAVPPVSTHSLRPLVSNLGDDYVDKQNEQCEILYIRERAIGLVKSPDLADTQKKVIDVLHDVEDEICRPQGD